MVRETFPSSSGTTESLDRKHGMSYCNNDQEFYFEILQAFTESDFAATLNSHLEEKNWKDYQISIHGLKSAAKSIGALPLSELAKASELALKERNDTDYILTNHPNVLHELEKVETLIGQFLNQ